MKLKQFIAKYQTKIQKGREVTLQMKAEKQRKRLRKAMYRKPGALKAISDGISLKKSPLDVMKEEYDRRKYEREQRHHGTGKGSGNKTK